MQQFTQTPEDSKDNTTEPQVEKHEKAEPGVLNNTGPQPAGMLLRKRRMDKGMTIEQVCEELNLSQHVVESIENDVSERLPEVTYVRGYIRSYANLLGMDPADVLMNYRRDGVQQSGLESMPRGIEEPVIGIAAMSGYMKAILVLGLILVVAGYLLRDDISGLFGSSSPDTAQTAEPVATLTPPGADSSRPESQQASVDENATAPAVAAPVNAEASAGSAVEGKEGLLELNFSGTSWVDIRDSAGKKLVYKSFPPGENISVEADLPLNVFVGNADAVTLTYGGRGIDLQAYKEEMHAKFTLNE